MKGLLYEIIKLAFFCFIFQFVDTQWLFYPTILLCLITTLKKSYLAPLCLLLPILTKNYYFAGCLGLVFVMTILTSSFSKRNKPLLVLTSFIILVQSRFYLLYMALIDLNLALEGILMIFTLIILVLFLISIKLVEDDDDKARLIIVDKRLDQMLFFSLSYAFILVKTPQFYFPMLLFCLVNFRFNSNKITHIMISLLNVFFCYQYLDLSFLLSFVIISIILIELNPYNCLAASIFLFLFHFKIQTPYISIYYSLGIIIPSLFLLFFKKSAPYEEYQFVKTTLTDFLQYLKSTNQNLNTTLTNSKLISKRIEDIICTYCKQCDRQTECFEKNKLNTYQFLKLSQTIKLDIFDISFDKDLKEYIQRCPHHESILALDKIVLNNETNLINLQSYERITTTLLDELYQKTTFNSLLFSFKKKLLRLKYNILNFHIKSKEGLFEICIELSDCPLYEAKSIIPIIASKHFKKTMKSSILEQHGSTIKFILFQEPKIKLTFEHGIISKNDLTISGDNFMAKKDIGGRYIFALSDGMGSGYKAFEESKEMLRLVRDISNTTFETRSMVELLDNFYNLKNQFDSYATLDLLQIDSINKEGILYKMGGTNSYLLSKGVLKIFYNDNLPLGINDLSDHFSFKVSSGDLILLVSDGVTEHIQPSDFQNYLLTISFKPVNKIVHELIEFCRCYQNNKIQDDLSIIAIKIS